MTTTAHSRRAHLVPIHVDRVYGVRRGLIQAVLACLLEEAGWQAVFHDTTDGTKLVYTPAGSLSGGLGDKLVLRGISPNGWDDLLHSRPVPHADEIIPDAALVRAGDAPWLDRVATAAFFLAGMHERDGSILESADAWATPGQAIANWGLDAVPPVYRAAEMVSKELRGITEIPPPAPRWPKGRHWAVALTHDFDRYRKYRPTDFFRASLRALAGRQSREAAANITKCMLSAAGRLHGRDPYARSLLQWMQLQESLGMRSAIYVAAVNQQDPRGTALDVTYTLDRELSETLSRLASEGWEIGLHSSINAWRHPDGFARERELLTQRLGVVPVGVRGHYWSLDRDDVSASLRRIAEAGFAYDSSLGMNVAHGYRRGASYPYRAFEEQTGNVMDVWELPAIMMDHALWVAGDTPRRRSAALSARVAEAKSHKGLLSLDWHTDSLADGYMDNSSALVVDLLPSLASDSACWLAKPEEIIAWCSSGRWSVAG